MAVTTTNLGVITAYGDAVAAGYTGTKAEWQALMASYATVGQQAVDAKNAAVAAKDTAVSKATEATTAANTATTKANEASASAQSIAQSASQIAQNTSDISELKEDFTTTASKEDMLKAFPTDTASGSVASFNDGANVPVKSLIVSIDPVQSGSGDPSPDNVRPISGHTQAVVTRTGVNVWDEEWELGIYSLSDGLPVPNASSIRGKNRIVAKPSTDYYCNNNNMRVLYYDESDNYLGFVGGLGIKTTPTNCAYIRMYLGNDYGTTYNHDVCINYPSTDHDYHPYSGQSINIALGQTVYGGTLDVTNGVLTIEDAKNIYDGSDDEAWQLNSIGIGICAMMITDNTTVNVSANTDTNINARSDRLQGQSANDIVYNRTVYKVGIITNHRFMVTVKDTDATGVTGFKSWLASNPITVCYKIATPISVQLTPHEVRSLLGDNNIWADSGDSEVVYRADPTLYIGRLTEPDADMVADANIVSGQYFMVGNTLYKATANIASGATIVTNVNCTRKSLSEALNELNA